MSRNLNTFRVVPYVGQVYGQPFNACGQTGRVVPLRFDWNNYGASTAQPNVMVPFTSLVGNDATGGQLPAIRSVYINNLNSGVAVYVEFDSPPGYQIACEPNAEGWFPVFTNSLNFKVAAQGFVTGLIPVTEILLTDIFVPAFTSPELPQTLDLWLASASISRGTTIYNQDNAVPALGDQTSQALIDCAANPGTAAICGCPLASGYVYLTDLWIKLIHGSTGGGTALYKCYLRDISITLAQALALGRVIYTFPSVLTAAGTADILLYQGKGNIKLDATISWGLDCGPTQGTGYAANTWLNGIFNFTTNPR